MTLPDLNKSLAACKGGETIALPGGAYPITTISRKVFSKTVTITAEDPKNPPVFGGLTVSNSEGIDLVGLTSHHEPTEKSINTSNPMRLNTVKRVNVIGCDLSSGKAIAGISQDADPATPRPGDAIIGLPVGRGLVVWMAEESRVAGNNIHGSHRGMVIDHSPGIVVEDNDIHDLRSTPIMGSDIHGAVFQRNRCWNFKPWKFGGRGDHGDMIHLFPEKGGARMKVKISQNLLDQADGDPLLGVYLDDGGVGIGYEDVEISENTFLMTSPQAVRLENVVRSRVIGNIGLQIAGDAKAGPSVIYRDCADLLTADNEMHDVFGMMAGQLFGTYKGNKILPAKPDDPAYIAATRAAWLKRFRPSEPPVVEPPPEGNELVIRAKSGQTIIIHID